MMHPRPHLVRHSWLSLDGTWSFAFDPPDEGERERWFRGRDDWPLRIEVPFPWESPRSGVGSPAPDRYVRGSDRTHGGIGWYRRQVETPPDWSDQRIWLVVGAASWEARVWIDGHLAGEHHGGYESFELDVTDLLDGRGAFELVIRVRAPEDTDEYPHGKNTRHWYSRASGIWQTVFVEPRPATHVDRLRVTPDPASGCLYAVLAIRAPQGGVLDLRMDVLLDAAVVVSRDEQVEVEPGVRTCRIDAVVPSPLLWALDSPTLYDVRMALGSGGGRVDVVETTIGFRSIAFDALWEGGPRWLHLNGEPLYVRAVMSQGYHPDGIIAYPDESTIRSDLESAKRLGFNMVRLHVKVEDPRLLAWADHLGMLLWCEVPDFLTPSAEARARWEVAWRAMLERDAGHPSIAMWCMFIESWGLGLNQFGFGGAERRFADDPEMQAWVEEMYVIGRALDATRPIIENSVCEADHTVAEVNDIHLFPSGYGELQVAAADSLDGWLDATYPGSGHNYAPGYVQVDQPLMVTSMAGWSSVDGVETSWPFRSLVNEVRARERIAGYGWVQLYDVEWELTGMLSYERRPKPFGYDVAQVNADDILVVHGSLARRLDAGAAVRVEVGLAHASGRVSGRVSLRAWLDGLDGSWQRVRPGAIVVGAGAIVERRGVTSLGHLVVPSPDAPFAGDLIIEAFEPSGRVVASTRVHVAMVEPATARSTASLLQLPLQRWAGATGEDLETIAVNGEPQRIASLGLECDFALGDPVGSDVRREVHLVAEAAVADVAHHGRSMGDIQAAAVHVLLDEVVVAEVMVTPLGADSAGVLSIVHPEGLGTYGGRLDATLGRHDRLAGERHRLSIRPARPRPGWRVVLFGPLLGRAPLGPALAHTADKVAHTADKG